MNHEPVTGHQGPRRGAGARRLRRRESQAASGVAVEIGDTSEEAMNINETTTESVEETEPADNAENTEKLENKNMVSEISIFTVAVEHLQ
jgi:hypothetical protein